MPHRNSITLVPILVVACGLAARAEAGDRTLYAIGRKFDSHYQSLMRFDPDDPSDSEAVGVLSPNSTYLRFLSYNPSSNAFFASPGDSNPTTMYRIDPVTGAATALGNSGAATLKGSAFVPSLGGTVVAHSNAGDASGLERRLSLLDPITGALSPLADFTSGGLTAQQEFEELTYDANRALLIAYTLGTYVEIDPADWSIVGSGVLPGLPGAPGVFYGDFDPTTGTVFSVGTTAIQDSEGHDILGSTSLSIRDLPANDIIGTAGIINGPRGIDGLAFIPTPGTIGVLGLGGLAVLRRRR